MITASFIQRDTRHITLMKTGFSQATSKLKGGFTKQIECEWEHSANSENNRGCGEMYCYYYFFTQDWAWFVHPGKILLSTNATCQKTRCILCILHSIIHSHATVSQIPFQKKTCIVTIIRSVFFVDHRTLSFILAGRPSIGIRIQRSEAQRSTLWNCVYQILGIYCPLKSQKY